jgi:hypothetical protein
MLSMPIAPAPVQYIQTAAPAECLKGQKRNSKGVCYTPQTTRTQASKCKADTRVLVCPAN